VATLFASDRAFGFDVGPDRFWETISRTDDFPRWWSWLHRFEADGLREGVVARCEVRAPLPYSLRFEVVVDRVVEGERIETTVQGDIAGPARLEVEPLDGGARCQARMTWALEPCTPLLRNMARFGRPLMEWGHDRVLEIGVRQFRRRALDGSR
jgi:hypothetical protein